MFPIKVSNVHEIIGAESANEFLRANETAVLLTVGQRSDGVVYVIGEKQPKNIKR